jgi:cyclophilin family peptidyl-prolyl cis-trans isomerase/HEAT repeat protein
MRQLIALSALALIGLSAAFAPAQVPANAAIQILKAEDARRFDKSLEALLASPNADIRTRAALAAGRIGDEAAVAPLAALAANDASEKTRAMAAFALGEIESAKGAGPILNILNDGRTPDQVRARAVEAAGKIAAANPKDERAGDLGKAILETLKTEAASGGRHTETVLLALTAALRARPEGTDRAAALFLTSADPRIRADAANTLSRVKAKNANETLRRMLSADADPVARANAARALGSAEDKSAADALAAAAAGDPDSRVRVSAIRSAGAVGNSRTADKLIEYGQRLLAAYKRSKYANPVEENELLEIAGALGRLLANSKNARAMTFLEEFARLDDGMTAEISLARFKIAPGDFENRDASKPIRSWRQWSTQAQLLGELADANVTRDEEKKLKSAAPDLARSLAEGLAIEPEKKNLKFILAGPDFLQAFARYKTDDLSAVLRQALKANDVFVRAAAAGLLAEQPPSTANTKALETAFTASLASDKRYDDAQLAILDAMFKINKAASVDTFYAALDAPDYLVRKKGFELLNDADLRRRYPGIYSVVESAVAKGRDHVQPYDPKTGTKLGQILNADADYRRAAARRNGTAKAVVATEKGTFTIDLFPEDAPLTVDNFIRLARSNYFNGVEVHRVVPNFVMQDGDPRGDGNGGPGWSIRCEINMVPYGRGAVGMALSGKDTGGSQWFVTHSPQPHLDGGYTVFGKVSNADMKVVDRIVRGDKIISVRIIENLPDRPAKSRKRR